MHILARRLVVAVLALLPAVTAAQDNAAILILDASGSMWTQLDDGSSRIEVARDVLGDFLAARDPAQPLGAIAYGHNRRSDCSDIEVLAPVAAQDSAALGARLRSLNPRGKTPLADALRRAATQIPQISEAIDIVLVTDGLETCGGDVCAVAADLAAMGVQVRAHVVGFGLSEQDIAQVACVADATGGLIFSTQSGAELADALLRTTTVVVADDLPDGQAQLNLTIRADIAGRPDSVQFSAQNTATGETLALGTLDFAQSGALPATLAAGEWRIVADAGDLGRGEEMIQVIAADNRTIYVPFQGLLPSLDMQPSTGAFRLGVNALLPYAVQQEGLATGGGDFIFSLLPLDATSTYDRRIDYSTQDSSLGSYVGLFRSPEAPGDYLVTFSRNADTPVDEVMERFVVTFVDRPDVTLIAPPAIAPGASVPVTIAGGMGNSDRIEVWKDGALYSWDQSIYLQEFFDNSYGPAKPLIAPSEPGDYEIVYVFSELDGDASIAARQPLTVGAVPDLDEAAVAAPGAGIVQQANATPTYGDAETNQDVGYSCPSDNGVPCFFDDAATGLVVALPPGWLTDLPTREGATAGSQPGPVRVTFFSMAEPIETIVLNPHQWITMNGPCMDIQPGNLCRFESDTPELAAAIAVLSRGIRDMGAPAPTIDTPLDASGDGYGEDAGAGRAWSDYPHRCLPDDKTDATCVMRDEATGLTFMLPENWVGEVFAAPDGPRADFFEVTDDARSMHLNPAAWPTPDRGCFFTRAGTLCTDMAVMDETLATALSTLTRYMTTGEVLRNCANDPCDYAFPLQGLSGTMPGRWGVEVGQVTLDGRISSWFYSVTPDFSLKLIGLNQPGGENCRNMAQGGTLCEHTPYISTEEFDQIASSLRLPAVSDVAPVQLVPVNPEIARKLADLLEGN